MAYRVDISPSALQDAEDAYLWVKYHSPDKAGPWYEGLLKAIFTLENSPRRCPLDPESDDLGLEIRQLLYGSRRRSYRILYGFGEDQKTGEKIVRIFRIRHLARRRITSDEIKEG
ncbi:MAG: type II toxin-antitoxin system RelE/ParE family toxin [Blastocatellia bacterium]|nr:type II toxin-antitoxin system RelE/ParE family toxin [Blastocatellia bacterium]